MNPKGRSSRMIITEGTNDMHVIFALCEKNNIPEGVFTVYDSGSDERAIKFLNASIIGSEPPEILGIVIDADNPSLDKKWKTLKQSLEKYGYRVPELPAIDGTIIEHDMLPKIGIWLMPDNQVNGMLEDFCQRMASPDHIEYAKNCALSAREKGMGNFIDKHLSKATICTYLAWQDSPGRPLGQSISARVLNHDVVLAKTFVDFLGRLFSLNKESPNTSC